MEVVALVSTEKEGADLRSLFQIITNDIKYPKRLQRTRTYYVLLTYVAIIGFYHYARLELWLTLWEKLLFLGVPPFGIGLLGMWHLMDTH